MDGVSCFRKHLSFNHVNGKASSLVSYFWNLFPVVLLICNGLRHGTVNAIGIGVNTSNNQSAAPAKDAGYKPYQPKTGGRCGCHRGVERDNCPNCEGTGWVIDFRAIRERNQKGVQS